VQATAVALVPVADGHGEIGLLVLAGGDVPGKEALLPSTPVDAGDATWQDAATRAVVEQTGLLVTFDEHVATVSTPDGGLLVFAQTHPVCADEVHAAGEAGATVIAAGEQGTLTGQPQAEIVARWFAERGRDDDGDVAADRRRVVSGRRATDAVALARTDAESAVRAVHELVGQGTSFSDDPYARTLLERVLRALVTDQRLRWGERGADLLLTFLWHVRREQLPVREMFAFAADWARREATADPAACFANPGIDRARRWMDSVALAHGIGQVMAPFHAAEPVGLVRSILGFGRFGRLEARLGGDAENVLAQLDEGQWERMYVALGAGRPGALRPAAFDPDDLLDAFADVLARSKHTLAGR